MAISNSETDPTAATEAQRKRKRTRTKPSSQPQQSQWKTEAEQKRYSSKLLEALRRVRPAADISPRSRAVREAADRALAVAARGRTRWSRAIISTRTIKLKLARKRRPAGPGLDRKKKTGSGPVQKAPAPAPAPALQRKAKVLGRLVPGCRKLAFPKLLEETSDYIAALQMQVRAMSALAQILSAAGSGGAQPADRPVQSEPI